MTGIVIPAGQHKGSRSAVEPPPTTKRITQCVGRLVGHRSSLPRLAMLGVPLGIAAALLSEHFLLAIPLAVCAWYWAPKGSVYWLVALGRGIVTTEWAQLGATAFATYPGRWLSVGAAWASAPLLLTLANAPVRVPLSSRPRVRTGRATARAG